MRTLRRGRRTPPCVSAYGALCWHDRFAKPLAAHRIRACQMNESESRSPEELCDVLQMVQVRLRRLTVAVMLLTLVLVLTVAAVFGELVNYFAGDAMMFGGVSIGAALLGFGFGWVAGRKA